MTTVGSEARPSRRVAHGEHVTWTIPESTGGKLEIACAVSHEDDESRVSAVFRVYRREGDGKPELLKTAEIIKKTVPQWTEVEVPWPAHRHPATLTIEAESRYRGEPVIDPVLTPALIAEPILVPRRSTGSPHFVLFMVDDLRADRIHCYGGSSAPATPEIDRLAAEGIRVEHAFSPSSWTLPAHASMFTSSEVYRHQAGGAHRTLGRELPTLAEVLRRAGYRTLAVTNGGLVDPAFGLARGFDRYFSVDSRTENVEESVQQVLFLLEQYKNEPVFLFFHTFEVHNYVIAVDMPKTSAPSLDPGQLKGRYNEKVVAMDAAFGLLRKGLEAMHLASRTSLILTADHGERLDDRPVSSELFQLRFGHGHPYLHDEDIRIPLIVFDPSLHKSGVVIPGPSSLLDVAPTVLATLGLPAQPTFVGHSLIGRAPDPRRVLLIEDPSYPALALRNNGRKIIVRPQGKLQNWWNAVPYPPLVTEELFDLTADPGEIHNRAGDRTGFDELIESASLAIADTFPGSLVLNAPSSFKVSEIKAACPSGFRRARVFGGDREDRSERSDLGVQLKLAPGQRRPDLWLALEPMKPLDTIELTIRKTEADAGPTEERIRWSSLFAGKGSPLKSPLRIYSARPRAPEKEGPEIEVGQEVLSRLRSLGYLSMPVRDRSNTSGDLLPPKEAGEGVIVIRTIE